jgi:Flp pilus assembly protein TadG
MAKNAAKKAAPVPGGGVDMLRVSRWSLREFARDAKANVAILFGVALVPILIGVGVAVDYGRALVVRERMADAADAAALAIGSWPGLDEDQLTAKAQQFFDANYPETEIGTAGKINVQLAGDDIFVTVSGSVPTTFMKLANFDSLDVGFMNKITKKQRNIEVVLVLDTTGSMGSGGKLNAMKNAAKKLVDTLFAGKSTSDTLRIGLVPYSGAVNIGTDKLDSGWLNKDTYTTSKCNVDCFPWEDLDKTNGISTLKLYKEFPTTGLRNRSWAGCVRERSGGNGAYELTDDPPSAGVSASLWVPYFAPDEPDSGSFSNDYISDGSGNVTCNKGPTSGSNANANKNQCRTSKYENKNASGGGPEYNCPPAPITAMTNVKSTIVSGIDALVANGYTVIPAGLLWGWRVISPGDPFTEGAPYDDEKWVKAMVLLTDGQNDVNAGSNGFNESVYNAFGYAKNGHLGNTNGSNAETTLNNKVSTVCNSIKARGIRLYTIGFQVSGSTITNLLRNCATEPDMYYNSPSNQQLEVVFADIAQGLSELRIAQ